MKSARFLSRHSFSHTAHILRTATAITLSLTAAAHAANFTVTSTSDNPTDPSSLRYDLLHASTGDTITLANNLGAINLTAPLPDITTALTINGGSGNTLSGQNLYRILFINAPGQSVQINHLALANGLAHGGNGGSGGGGGGGGAGLGGAVFINAGAATFSAVSFLHNAAIGGMGGDGSAGGGGGGGGLDFSGGNGDATANSNYFTGPGGGGGAHSSAGASAIIDVAGHGGGLHGGAAGISGSETPAGGNASGPDGGGGGAGYNPNTSGVGTGTNGGNGADFGGGGGSGSALLQSVLPAGNGGFGAGGGGGGDNPFTINGGNGGNGGFGAGGGGAGAYAGAVFTDYALGGTAGTGGGNGAGGNNGGGGGGAAFGASLFVRADNGASLSFADSSTDSGSITPGIGGAGFSNNTPTTAANGTAAGTALYLTAGNANFSVSAASSQTIAGSIAGPAALTKLGAGTLILSASNTFTGNTTISAGTLSLQNTTLPSPNASIAAGATLEYNFSSKIFQPAITFTGNGTLRKTGSNTLVFGGLGNVNVNLAQGALIDVQSGTLIATAGFQGIWTANLASLNIAPGATFSAVEGGPSALVQLDALTGGGTLSAGYVGNPNATTTIILGAANGSGTFAGTLSDLPAAHLALIKTGTGTQTLSGTNTYSGNTTIHAGTLLLASSNALPSAGNLSIDANASAVFGSVASPIAIKLTSLTLAGATDNWTAALDLTASKLILEPANKPAALTTLQNQLTFGSTHTNGINSSFLPPNDALALLDNAVTHFTTFGGQPADTNSLLLSPELLGDANADGTVNLLDLNTVLQNFGSTTPAWTSGNFDHAPTIDLTDLADVLNNFSLTNANANTSELPMASDGLPASAPEPASLTLVFPALLINRRRRPSPVTYTAS